MLNAKNSSNFTKFSKILIGLTAFLTILYILSFTKSCSSTDKREMVKTALVNPKYKDSIDSITLQDATGSIELSNQNGFWIVKNQAISLPTAPERMEKFIEELIKVRNLYKISDKINKNSSLGLTNGTEFHIRYTYNSGAFYELIFGNQDFSLSSRYLMTGESSQVYEINDSLDPFLTSAPQSWAEPYIISRTAINSALSNIQSITVTKADFNGRKSVKKISEGFEKLFELRHGGLAESEEINQIENQEAQMELEIENGDKSSITLEIYESSQQEGSFIVKASYIKADSKKAFYKSYSKISSWTYNKIKEITL